MSEFLNSVLYSSSELSLSNEGSLQYLPEGALDTILNNFSYEFCLSLRTLSSSFHHAVRRKFRRGYKSLFTRLSKQVSSLGALIEEMANHLRTFSDGDQILVLLAKYSIMKVLESEAIILKAICQRYVEKGKWDFVSSNGARLFDHFHSVISLLIASSSDTASRDPEVTSGLLFLCGEFIDDFISSVEPKLDLIIPFEVKLADILDSCREATVSYKIFYWDLGYRMSTNYYLKKLTSLEYPWDIFDNVSTEEKLKSILTTMKNNVRYINYSYPLREVWFLEDILEENGVQGLKEYLIKPKHYHIIDNQEVPCYIVHDELQWRKGINGWKLMADEVYREKLTFDDSHTVEAELQIEYGPKPLKLLNSINETDFKCDLTATGICEVNLYIEHPMKCDVRVHKSCVRIEGKRGSYSIKCHGHQNQ